MKFQDILPDRRKFNLTRLDTFREDWTILSSKGNSLVNPNRSRTLNCPPTLSRHYKEANVQIFHIQSQVLCKYVVANVAFCH